MFAKKNFEKYFGIFSEQTIKNFEKSKIWKFDQILTKWKIQIFDFSKFRFFEISIFCSEKNPKYFRNFSSRKCFGLEKIFFGKSFYLCQLKIFPGFQKSHLEQRAVRLKSRKTRDPVFFSEFPDPGILLHNNSRPGLELRICCLLPEKPQCPAFSVSHRT